MIDAEETFHSYHRELLARMQAAVQTLDDPDGEDDAAFSVALSSLAEDFVRYVEANEASLYPAVAPLIRSEEEVMAPMKLDVRVIADDAAEGEATALEALTANEQGRRSCARRIRLLAAGVEAIIRLHFFKLERIYLPLLAELPAEQRRAILEEMTVAYGPPSPWPEAPSAAGRRRGSRRPRDRDRRA
jgi:Hemerythrin HHE cation binding domain